MSRWTNWRLIADQSHWYDDFLDWDGPACYELALGVPGRIEPIPMYVGETCNERQRLARHASNKSHLAELIESHLREGWLLFYRARVAPSKERAKLMQDNLLRTFEYEWNIRG